MLKENLASKEWELRYCTSDVNSEGKPTDILHDFYIPALKRATSYDRVAGYFRSTSLAAASQGYTAFLNHEGHMRLIVGADLQLQDIAAILAGNRQRLSDALMHELEHPETWPDEVQNGVSLLGAMVASGQLEVKVAFRINANTGDPMSVDATDDGYVHEKWFIMGDGENHLYGSGSLNESKTALTSNAENVDINCDWEGGRERKRVEDAISKFDVLWEGKNPHMLVIAIPDAVKERLVRIKNLKGRPTEIDGTVLKEEVQLSPMEILRFAVLKDAPKMPGGIYIGMYSAPVEPWPHQEIVSRRLIESWPYSYMMCDEVGLGKTIEAALAIRSLALSGRVKRILIIAPKSLTEQWHRELAQKAMLPFYRSQAKPGLPNKVEHIRIYPSDKDAFVDGNRKLLEIYREHGELKSNLAKRTVLPICAIQFTPDEAAFYDMLEAYCKELSRQIKAYNPQTRQVMVFLLNFMQLRFASSLYAIQQTLIRRLKKVNATLLMGAKTFHSKEELEEALRELELDENAESGEYSEGDLDDITIEALLKDRSKEDLKWEKGALEKMLEKLDAIHETPSKIQRLLQEIDRRRIGGRVRQLVLFTRFYDSLHSIRQYLLTRDPGLRVGVYSGGNSTWYDPSRNADVNTTHEDIKHHFINGDIDILLCTDAAAEGLNLQTADLLINFDLGWNPMKIEQRIGRIDRIGQKYEEVFVMNMCYLGSTEETVYGRLFERLASAGFVVGTQQISMLPVTAEEFRKLGNKEITLDELERESKKRLREHQKATAAMEISAEDLYDMYRSQSKAMKAMDIPAGIEELHKAITESEYLKHLGMTVKDGVVNVPDSDELRGFMGTISRDMISDECGYLTWGNPALDSFMETVGTIDEELTCMRRLSYESNGSTYVGYAVATTQGVHLITSYKQLENITIDKDHCLTDEEVSVTLDALKSSVLKESMDLKSRCTALNDNKSFAILHDRLIHVAASYILQDLLSKGSIKYGDALKTLDANRKRLYYVPLKNEEFGGKGTRLLFPIIESSGQVQVAVSGILFDCVYDLITRTTSEIRKKKSEINTADVIRRLGKSNQP